MLVISASGNVTVPGLGQNTNCYGDKDIIHIHNPEKQECELSQVKKKNELRVDVKLQDCTD